MGNSTMSFHGLSRTCAKVQILPIFTKETTNEQKFSRTIVSDPAICHGEPTFRGTRILVADALEQIASGMAFDAIIAEWRGAISREMLAEVSG